MYRVKKRDGKITDFDIQKIINALRKEATGSITMISSACLHCV